MSSPPDDSRVSTASQPLVSALPNGERIGSQAVLRNVLLLFGFHVLTKLLAFVSFILLANFLGTQLFGIYNYAFALTALFIPLCDLGMDTYLMREVPRSRAEEVPRQLGAVLAWKGALTFIVFGLISAIAAILDAFATERFFIVVLAGLVTLMRAYWTTFGSLLRALNKVGYETALLSIARIAEFAVILGCVLLEFDLLLLLSLLGAVNLTAVGTTYVFVRARFAQPSLQKDFNRMMAILKGGLPFALTSIFTSIYFNFDTVLIARFIDDHAAGIYRAAYNLILPLMMITAAVSGAVFPYVSQNFRQQAEEVSRVLKASAAHLLMVAVMIAIITTVLADKIIALLFTPEYGPAAVCLAILVWFIPIVYLTNLFGNALGAMDQQVFVLKITAVNVVFNVTANLIVIPVYAQVGAAVTTVATELLGLTFLTFRIRRYVSPPVSPAMIGKITLGGGLTIGVLHLAGDLHVLWLLGLGIIAYAGALAAMRAVSLETLRQLRVALAPHRVPPQPR